MESLEEPFNVVIDEGTKITITGAQLSIVVDNAEYHLALAFVKSLSKAFCCERCLTSVDDFNGHFDQSKCLLRSFKSFTKNVEKAQLNRRPSKGVRAKSHLETKNFSAYRNWTADIQHDLFEGGTQYTLKLVIHNLIFSRKVISLIFLFIGCSLLPTVERLTANQQKLTQTGKKFFSDVVRLSNR